MGVEDSLINSLMMWLCVRVSFRIGNILIWIVGSYVKYVEMGIKGNSNSNNKLVYKRIL